MIFLIQYNRRQGTIVVFDTFDSAKRTTAENRRLELELELNRRGVRDEVILLEAADKDALRRTHRRYFENASEIITSATPGPDRLR
jgi:hypothetical protein